MHEPHHCKSCNAEILWCQILDDEGHIKLRDDGRPKAMPVDYHPVANGTAIVFDRRGVVVARILKKGEQPKPGELMRMPHHVTCPNRDDWHAVARAKKGAP